MGFFGLKLDKHKLIIFYFIQIALVLCKFFKANSNSAYLKANKVILITQEYGKNNVVMYYSRELIIICLILGHQDDFNFLQISSDSPLKNLTSKNVSCLFTKKLFTVFTHGYVDLDVHLDPQDVCAGAYIFCQILDLKGLLLLIYFS